MKVNVNGKKNFEVEIGINDFKVDGVELKVDLRKLSKTNAHIVWNYKSYNVELISENRTDKTYQLKINGNIYNIQIEDQYDELLKRLGLDNARITQVKEIKAPMPGLVLNVIVKENTEVNKGDSLVILEAMKMENIIKSPTDGTIKKILVNIGDKVDKNDILIQFN